MVSRAPGAAQTPKIDDFQPAQKLFIKSPSVVTTLGPQTVQNVPKINPGDQLQGRFVMPIKLKLKMTEWLQVSYTWVFNT